MNLKSSIIISQTSIIEKIAYYTSKLREVPELREIDRPEKRDLRINMDFAAGTSSGRRGSTRRRSSKISGKLTYPSLVEACLVSSFPAFKKTIQSIYNACLSYVKLIVGEKLIQVQVANEILEWRNAASKQLFDVNKTFVEMMILDDLGLPSSTYSDPRAFKFSDFPHVQLIKNIRNSKIKESLVTHFKKLLIEILMVFDRIMLFLNFLINRERIREKVTSFGYERFMNKMFKYLSGYSQKASFILLNDKLTGFITSILTRLGRNGAMKKIVVEKFEWYGLYYEKLMKITDRPMTAEERKNREDFVKTYERNAEKKKTICQRIKACICCETFWKKVDEWKERKEAARLNRVESEDSSIVHRLNGDERDKFNLSLKDAQAKEEYFIRLKNRELLRLKSQMGKRLKRRCYYTLETENWVYQLFTHTYEQRGKLEESLGFWWIFSAEFSFEDFFYDFFLEI